MSAPTRLSLDYDKLSTLSKEESVNLIKVLVENLNDSLDEKCLQFLSPYLLSSGKEYESKSENESEKRKEIHVEGDDVVRKDLNDDKLIGVKDVAPKKKKQKKIFDISNYRQRHIALHVYYDGAKYLGFASSTDGDTVEGHLFDALVKLRLIESRATCGYSRCGRTDKGVSAAGQVIALRMRSNLPAADVQDVQKNMKSDKQEMDYCGMLNKELPEDIRILGWCEVSDGFSARFSALNRTYRYFFLRNGLNIAAMQKAASLLIGDHDFRNMCKMDIANVSNFRRSIYTAEIKLHSGGGGAACEVWMLEITGIAFLWHMVRCIMAVLFLVGHEKESPDVVTSLLDIEKLPSKPEYFMAPELPLVLYHSGYENLNFTYNVRTLFSLVSHFDALYERFYLAAVRVQNVMNFLKEVEVSGPDLENFMSNFGKSQHNDINREVDQETVKKERIKWHDALDYLKQSGIVPAQYVTTKKDRNNKYERHNAYVPLLDRSRAETYDTRIQNLKGSKRTRLNAHEEKRNKSRIRDGKYVEDGDTFSCEDCEKDNHGSTTRDFFKRMRSEGSTNDGIS